MACVCSATPSRNQSGSNPTPGRGPESPASGSTATSLLVAVAAVVALWATYRFAVGTGTGQILDTRIMDFVARSLNDASWTSATLTLISPATALIAIAALAVFAWLNRGAAVAAAATTTAVGTMALAVVLKEILVRPALVDIATNSFPSGHVAAVAGVVAGATMAVSRSTTRLLVALAGAGGIAAAGVATLALRWHRASDVVASALLAIAVAMTAQTLLHLRRRQN